MSEPDIYRLISRYPGALSSPYYRGQSEANDDFRAGKERCQKLHLFAEDVAAGYAYEWERLKQIREGARVSCDLWPCGDCGAEDFDAAADKCQAGWRCAADEDSPFRKDHNQD